MNPDLSWPEANQRCLVASLAKVRRSLEIWVKRQGANAPGGAESKVLEVEAQVEQEIAEPSAAPSALTALCTTFRLSSFERDLLLLCAGPDLDARFGGLLAQAQHDTRRAFATFGLALAALANPHWSAVLPRSPLRRWRLIEVGTGDCLTSSPLRIDEWVLHFLAGTPHLDDRLQAVVRPMPQVAVLPASHRILVEQIVRAWERPAGTSLPIIGLCRGTLDDQIAIAERAGAAMRCRLYRVPAPEVPTGASERENFARLWEREAWLCGSLLVLDFHEGDHGENIRGALALCESLQTPVICLSPDPLRLHNRQMMRFDVAPASAGEQHDLWRESLGPLAVTLNGQLQSVVSQFSFSARQIHEAAATLQETPGAKNSATARSEVWRLCRTQSSHRLDSLAQRIDQTCTWEDLVLPEEPLGILRDIARHVRQRFRVYETWGFGAKGSRGLGISALFSGPSGTGKTLAAEVLANELDLDLFRIDLSSVVSKYIGETEKNLRRVFDAAETGGAILLFDEADALFGKRSEVKDSHDRYANIEVSYLLQRMESYRGLAILTTNLKQSLDPAFTRRLRFMVQFPFPDCSQRAEIWRRSFPAATPAEALDPEKLARLNVAGGNIRNIALNAAFLAADTGEPVRMKHLLQAARRECARLERAPSESELGGWV